MNRLEILQTLRSINQPVDWEAVYTSELPRIYNYFLYKVYDRELAQDLSATTFERAWKTRSNYRAILASPSAWLFGIARNVYREHLRINKATKPLPPEEQLPSVGDVEQGFQEQQDKEFLRSLLLQLSEREQDLIALKYGAGLSNREIAKLTRYSESNVGSILHRTVTNLRQKWNDRYER